MLKGIIASMLPALCPAHGKSGCTEANLKKQSECSLDQITGILWGACALQQVGLDRGCTLQVPPMFFFLRMKPLTCMIHTCLSHACHSHA